MEIKASPPITAQPPDGLGFSIRRASRILTDHDQEHRLKVDNLLTILLLTKNHTDHVELIVVHRNGNHWVLGFGAKLYPDLPSAASVVDIYSMPPLELLQAFVDSFGLEIRVGDKEGRFFLQERVQLTPGSDMTKALSIVDPPKRKVSIVTFMKPASPSELDLALVFGIDPTPYGQWLDAH